MGKVSLVLPIYNEEIILKDVLAKYIADLDNIRTKMEMDWEIVAVDDCSADRSKLILLDYAKQYRNFKVVSLAERAGKHAAVTAGFSVANGDIVLTAEIDLQNPLGLLETMVQEHLESGVPIIYGYREFHGGKKRKAIITDRLTRMACKLFILDGYFNGIVNAELYAGDVADIIRANPTKNKYMRTMNNWVGYQTKELWYAPEYTDEEARAKQETLRHRNRQYRAYKKHGHEGSLSKWYAVLSLFFAVVAFGCAVASLRMQQPLFTGLLFVIGFGCLAVMILFCLRSVLLARVGRLNYRDGEVIYEIKSILN